MTVATLLNSSKGAELIREQTGRSCTRQNLEKLCKQGKLPKSCVSLSPIRVNAETLVAEYSSTIEQRQTNRFPPKPRKPVVSVLDRAPESVPPAAQERGEVIPEYNESRAKTEYERANLLELERRQKEGLLVERKTVESTWSVLVTNAKTKLLAVPSRAKQRIPHLTLEEVEILNDLVRESLEDLAGTGAEE